MVYIWTNARSVFCSVCTEQYLGSLNFWSFARSFMCISLKCYRHFCSWTVTDIFWKKLRILNFFFAPALLCISRSQEILDMCTISPPESTTFHLMVDLYLNHAFLNFWLTWPFSGYIVSPMGLMLLQGQYRHHLCLTF